MKTSEKTKLIVIALFFFFLFNFPFIGIIDHTLLLGYIPFIYVYFYVLSLALILAPNSLPGIWG